MHTFFCSKKLVLSDYRILELPSLNFQCKDGQEGSKGSGSRPKEGHEGDEGQEGIRIKWKWHLSEETLSTTDRLYKHIFAVQELVDG